MFYGDYNGCARYTKPVFICSSATVGNPQEHVEALFHQPFKVIDRDGAPRPQRDLYFMNPPLVQSHGAALYRKGPASISIPLMCAQSVSVARDSR